MSKIKGRAAVAAAVGAVVIAGGAAAAFAAGPVSAAPASRAATGTEHFTIGFAEHGKAGDQQTFIAHGRITGGGRDDASHQNYDVLHFGNGTLRVNHPNKNAKTTFRLNKKTCYATLTLTGKYTLGSGTGKYRGVTGHGTYKGVGEYIAKRKANGACAPNSVPAAGVFQVHGSGPITTP